MNDEELLKKYGVWIILSMLSIVLIIVIMTGVIYFAYKYYGLPLALIFLAIYVGNFIRIQAIKSLENVIEEMKKDKNK